MEPRSIRRVMLHAKLHRARVTHANLNYEGSCGIDSDLLERAGILEYEQVQIYNVDNGNRFTTYAIRAERGSRVISANGAAARLVAPGDRLIICAYAEFEYPRGAAHRPIILCLDDDNGIKSIKSGVDHPL